LRFRRVGIALVVLAFGPPLFANTTPAPRTEGLPDIRVQTDDGRTLDVSELLRSTGEGPVILLPLFTRCSTSCPTLVQKLKESLAVCPPSMRVRVLIFSFDPAETQASLSAFRAASRFPKYWSVAHAADGPTRDVLRYLDYPVMTRGEVLIHPSRIFLLDESFRWKWTIDGTGWTSKDLAQVIERTDSPGYVSRLESHPEAIAWTALGFALGGICLAITFWSRHLTYSVAGAFRNRCIPSESNSSQVSQIESGRDGLAMGSNDVHGDWFG
jgi:cytochrome oxidase Cu insertion factor (SCO1/SenC/PrrC family)